MGSLRSLNPGQEVKVAGIPRYNEYQTSWHQNWQGRKVLVVMWCGGLPITDRGNDIVLRIDICQSILGKTWSELHYLNYYWRPTVLDAFSCCCSY